MTIEEAIAIIENEKECVNRANKNDYCNRDCYNCELVKTDTEILMALNMAIQALRAQADGDYISRQAILNLIVANHTELNGLNVVMYSPLYRDIIQLPSIKPPQPKTEKVIKMRDATPEEQEAVDKYIKSISKPTGINVFDFYENEEKSCNNCKHHLKFMCKKWETCHDYSDWEFDELDFVQSKKTIPCTVKIQEQSKTKFWELDDNDDCISRKAVLSILADHFNNPFDRVRELPPVAISYDGDLISRQDLIVALSKWWFATNENEYNVYELYVAIHKVIKELPTVAIPSAESCDFAKWVASEIFNDMWEYNKDSFAEIACRKLEKLGIVRAKGDEWKLVELQEVRDKE